MKSIVGVICFIFCCSICVRGQELSNSKVHWVKNKNWSEIKKIAASLNRPIFIDCYTTWCGPCKFLDREVYTNDSVGMRLNKDYVCLRLQFDQTEKDDPAIRSWYATTKKMIAEYNITGYPTLLFLDSKGNLLTKSTGVYTENAISRFLQMIDEAQNPQSQFYPILKSLRLHPNDESILKKGILASNNAGEYAISDSLMKIYVPKHLHDFSQENTQFLLIALHRTSDPHFAELVENRSRFDATLNTAAFTNLLMHIIMNSHPYYEMIFSGRGQSGMHYTLPEPNWSSIQDSLNIHYPSITNQVIAYSKIDFWNYELNWTQWYDAVHKYVLLFKKQTVYSDLAEWSKDIKNHFPNDTSKIVFADALVQKAQ